MKFTLSYPVKPWIIHQRFGVCASPELCEAYKSFGLKAHNGIDTWAPDGHAVYSAHDGEVTYAGYEGQNNTGGLMVMVRSLEPTEYNGAEVYMRTIYLHLKHNSVIVKPGQKVKTGDLLALADNTGFSTGSHLHFMIKPQIKLNDWDWANYDQDNGYKGAIDPEPFFTGEFAQDVKARKLSDKIEETQLPKGDPDQSVLILFAKLLKLIGL